MKYTRTYELQATHFNGQVTYDNYEKFLKYELDGDFKSALDSLKKVLSDLHGHNFIITVIAETVAPFIDYPVDDVFLTEIVMYFNNKNLSILPEFNKIRATTENFCIVLKKQLLSAFPLINFKIIIQETTLIKAEI